MQTDYDGFDKMKHCLIIDQGTLSSIVKYDSLVNVYEKLLKLDNLLFFFKKHPVQSVENKEHHILFKDCIELVDYVPVEMFFSYVDGFVVSAYSTSLVCASKISDIIVVSLLDVIEWYDEQFKKGVKEGLIEKSGGKVLFPCDIKELEYIIRNNNE